MATIEWDQVGSRYYESGIDRAVLYPSEGNAVPWNGITSVAEKMTGDVGTPIYFDGIKFGDAFAIGDYAATVKAFTYPNEFMELEGVAPAGNGLFIDNQRPKRFGLSYRTKIGNDDGPDLGYKIHVVYNLTAIPAQKNYKTQSEADAVEFEWTVVAVPEKASGFRPTAHIIFDTRLMNPLLLADMEETLYGTDSADGRLPPLSTLVSFISSWVIIRITDNLDGTWTAEGPDEMITMLDSTTFQISQANAVYLDADTYNISNKTR